MSTFTTSNIVTELVPNPGYKEIIIETPATMVSSTDEVTMTLSNYGIDATGFIGISGYEMSTVYGIIRTEAPNTFVSAGVLTISGATTIAHPAKKIYRVVGRNIQVI